jgi:predicted Rossmann fold nucleotide-binding protein DprA/Smf involved in DNA uptake
MSDYYPSIDTAWRNSPLGRMAYAAPARARRTDPVTSHEAAKRAPVAGHCAKVLEALGAGPAGQTEIARRAGLTVAAVSKRLPELRRAGLVERTGREVECGESEYRVSAASR